MAKKPERKLVFIHDRWVIADKVDASEYGPREPKGEVWMEPETTAWLARVGEEKAVADLPPNP